MEILKYLSESKNIENIIENLKKYFEKKFNSKIKLYKTEEIKEFLSVKETKRILIDREILKKNGEVFFPLHDEDKIYVVFSLKTDNKETIEEIKNVLNSVKIFIKNFRLYEDAKSEILRLRFLFDFHRALESKIQENIRRTLEELNYLLGIKGIFFKTKKFEIKTGSFRNIESSYILNSAPEFETHGEVLALDKLKAFCFSKNKTLILVDKENMKEEDKEFMISVLNLTEEWEEEKLPFSYEFIKEIVDSDFEQAIKLIEIYLRDEFKMQNPRIIIKGHHGYRLTNKAEEFDESIEDKKNLYFHKIKSKFEEFLIADTRENPELPVNYLALLFNLIGIKREFENLDKLNRVLKRTVETVLTARNIDDFLHTVGYIIKEELNVTYVGFLLKEDEEHLRMRIGIGYENYEELLNIKLRIGVDGLSGHVAQTGEKIYVSDVSKDPRYVTASSKVKSEVALPLKTEHEIFGVMVVSSSEVDGFNQRDIEIFEAIAGFVSFFIKDRKAIDELKKELFELKEEGKFMEVILKNIPVGIIYADRDLYIKRVNHSALYTLGLKEEEIKGMILCQIFEHHEPGSPECIFRRSIEERMPLVKKNVEIIREEERIPLSLSSTFIYEKDSIKGIILMIEDIKEVVALEEQLRRTERLSAIGRIAAHMAHEIKNPLASISVGIEFIYSSLPDEDPKKKHLGVILKEISRLDRLIKNLLSFARRPPLKRKRVNIKELIEEAIIFHGQEFKERNIKLNLNIPEYEIYAYVDEDQIKEVLENLIRNAMEAMPEGGELTISASEKSGGIISIVVEDTGTGIEPSELAHIFEPFYTTKKGGSGLGLPIVHRIIEDHGGKISVESEKGKGTKFIIDLPK